MSDRLQNLVAYSGAIDDTFSFLIDSEAWKTADDDARRFTLQTLVSWLSDSFAETGTVTNSDKLVYINTNGKLNELSITASEMLGIKTQVSTNKGDIVTLASDVVDNTTNIATNVTNISTLANKFDSDVAGQTITGLNVIDYENTARIDWDTLNLSGTSIPLFGTYSVRFAFVGGSTTPTVTNETEFLNIYNGATLKNKGTIFSSSNSQIVNKPISSDSVYNNNCYMAVAISFQTSTSTSNVTYTTSLVDQPQTYKEIAEEIIKSSAGVEIISNTIRNSVNYDVSRER